MKRIVPHIFNETGQLKKVVLGIALNSGPTPTADECYDPKSRESVLKGIYPKEEDLISEMEAFATVLRKYEVDVLRPKEINDLNQVFARDVSFAIRDKFIIPNIIEDREDEFDGIEYLIDLIDPDCVVEFRDGLHAEGGDCMPWNNHLFVGFSKDAEFEKYATARTNQKAVDRLIALFPDMKVYPIELVKSDTDPRLGVLHLDCCFQPIGQKEAIIYPGGFKNQVDLDYLTDLFGADNLIKVSQDEFYHMYPNIFSINEKTVISNTSFTRLNQELENRGYTVEKITYDEVSKMGGLLRCSTMPLYREKI